MVQGKFVSSLIVVFTILLLQLVSANDCEFQTKHYAISGFVGFGAVLGTFLLIGSICNVSAYCAGPSSKKP
uniref:Candidate secreted effector n=1 Tax=Meloidogyne incognita TaxID=6306 RepID=A0A914NCU1_MELIC